MNCSTAARGKSKIETTGVPADLDPPRFGPPGPNPLADKDPPGPNPLADMDPPGPNTLADLDPLRGFGPPTKLSENIVLNVLVKMDDTLRSSAY